VGAQVLEVVWNEEGAGEEIFGEKELDPVFLELSSCLFAASFSRGCSIGEVGTADLKVLLPRGRARDGNGHPELLELGPSAVLLVGHCVGDHFGVTLVAGGKDCLVETVGEQDGDEEMLLTGALEADFEAEDNIEGGKPLWRDFEDGDGDEALVEEKQLLCEESEELNSSSSAISPSSPLGYMLPFRALSSENVSLSRLSSRGLAG